MRKKHRWMNLFAGLTGVCLQLEGCDPAIRSTIENGIIDLSTGLLSSFFAALLQLFTEANA